MQSKIIARLWQGFTHLLAVLVAVVAVCGAASAQLTGTQRQGTIAPIPVAIPEFVADDARLGLDIAEVIANDLASSGLFQPLDRAGFLERIRDINVAPNLANWRAVRADALVAGRVGRSPDGRIAAEFRLWDTVSGNQKAAARFATAAPSWRRLGHLIADVVYEKMTGEKGYFDTRVVFVDETGPKDHRTKRLAIMDQDGWPQSVRLLTQGQELVLTPRFSPVAQEITFMTYTKTAARVFVMNLETGQRDLIGEFPSGVNTFAPRFAPDGRRVILSLEENGTTAIYEINLQTRQSRRVTQPLERGIDTGPSYSPDGRQIAFESDREGTQQIYVMDAGGGGIHRISAGEGRYSTPVWSPRGDYIAFTKQQGGLFLIGVMKPDGTGERILTEGYHNEGPTWAPNGRVLMFFRESQGANGGPHIWSVDITGYNEREIRTPSFASDPAWSPVQN